MLSHANRCYLSRRKFPAAIRRCIVPIQAHYRETVPIKVNAKFAPKVPQRRLHELKLRVSIKG